MTDLNHNVHNLLKRELKKAGHIIYTACNRKEAHEAVSGGKPLDMVILDPELSEIFGKSLFEELKARKPHLTIIIHTFIELLPDIDKEDHLVFVEKNEKSIHSLKKIIQEYSAKKAAYL
ncbi:MAG: response regulator [Desulfamplus sp.]|nr:response regulator [Desulfamplus sp.]